MLDETPFEPEAFLHLADVLAADDADEAMLRSAISRAYYAVFLMVRDKAGVTGRQSAHERVRVTLSPSSHRLASLLGTMANLRNIADYDLVPAEVQHRDWRRNWEQTRLNASRALEELRRLL
jgi:hypothetical protein